MTTNRTWRTHLTSLCIIALSLGVLSCGSDDPSPGGFDGVILEGGTCIDVNFFGVILPEFLIVLRDSSQTALDDDLLRPELFDTALYDLRSGSVKGCDELPCDAVSNFDFAFTFRVDAIAVPEAPGAGSLLGAALGLLGCGRARVAP